jgi:hypothetical protein
MAARAEAREKQKTVWTMLFDRDAYVHPCGCVTMPEHRQWMGVYYPCEEHERRKER